MPEMEQPPANPSEESAQAETTRNEIHAAAALLHHRAAASEDPEARGLFTKSYQAVMELNEKGDAKRKEAFVEHMNAGQEFAGMTEGDIIYFKDHAPLSITAVDREEKEITVVDLNVYDRGEEVEGDQVSFSNLLYDQENITHISKIGRKEPQEAAPEAEVKPEVVEEAVRIPVFSQQKVELQQQEALPEPEIPKERVKWKPVIERSDGTTEKEKELSERRQYLDAAFSAYKDSPDLKVSKDAIAAYIKKEIGSDLQGKDPNLVKHRFSKDEDFAHGVKAMRYFMHGDKSLRDVLDSAKSFKELKALKLMSLALLDSKLSPEGQKPWNEMSETQKRMTRLGELIGLEVERRQIELALQNGQKMEQGVVERAYIRYQQYAAGEDIPGMFQQRFTATAESLAGRYSLDTEALKPPEVKPVSPAQEVPDAAPVETAAASPDAWQTLDVAAGKAVQPEVSLWQLRQSGLMLESGKRQLGEQDPTVRELEQSIHEERFEYQPEFLEQLSSQGRSSDLKSEALRQNFINSLAEQMRYCQFNNNKPTWLDKAVRGIADGMSARWQVFGLRGLLRPWKTGQELQAVRADVLRSFQQLAQSSSIDKNFLAYHMAELGLANVNYATPRSEKGLQEADEALNQYYEQQVAAAGQAASVQPPDNQTAADAAIAGYYSNPLPPLEAPAEPLKEEKQEKEIDEAEVKLFNSIAAWQADNTGKDFVDWKLEKKKSFKMLQEVAKDRGIKNPELIWRKIKEQYNTPPPTTAA